MADKKLIYGIFILKRDGQHLVAQESENFDEMLGLWKEYKEQWTISLKDQKPFELLKPIVTAFDPGLIYEITVRPIPEAVNTNSNNPYVNKMQQEGLGSVLGNRGSMLDQGFRI